MTTIKNKKMVHINNRKVVDVHLIDAVIDKCTFYELYIGNDCIECSDDEFNKKLKHYFINNCEYIHFHQNFVKKQKICYISREFGEYDFKLKISNYVIHISESDAKILMEMI